MCMGVAVDTSLRAFMGRAFCLFVGFGVYLIGLAGVRICFGDHHTHFTYIHLFVDFDLPYRVLATFSVYGYVPCIRLRSGYMVGY
jgi:hypothetical protein